jgi:hypothetical protein
MEDERGKKKEKKRKKKKKSKHKREGRKSWETEKRPHAQSVPL